ncbi:WXG100 family type VII secretion target [Terribacillus saccharophilus]|uniref:WXG100 family type VII secretion target n=1 Tax=Terribacillus saccharophilus TaxID=361277 RepID=UPI00398249F3
MSGQIRMTPEELKSRAETYGQSAEQINDILRTLTTLQDQIAAEWEGQAFVRFDEQFDALKPKVTEFSQLMDDIKRQLISTADAVRDQDEALSQNFGFR